MGIPAVYLDTMMPVEQTRKFSQIKRRLSTQVSFSVYDAVVTYSAAMRNALEESGVPRSKIHTIANGLDLSRFCPVRNVDEQSQLRKKLGFGTDDEIVVFAGTIMYRKGVHLLIDAWPHLINARPNVRLVLLGNTTSFNEYVISLQRLVSASPKADRVHFMGIVGNIEDYMRAADLFVLPSYLEGLPHVVIEAMACGLPCLLTPFPGITPELGEAGRHFQLVPYDGEAIAHAAADLLSNRPRASAMGQLAAAQVRPLFNIEDALDAYAELYHRVAHKVK